MHDKCHHGHRHIWCGICIPKVRWPKGYKSCRCHALIPKDWPQCARCKAFESEDFYSDGPVDRAANFSVCRELNRVG